MTQKEIDKTDAKILDLLQRDSRMTNQELSEQLGMSASPCWRRIKRLQDEQIIRGYGVLLDRKNWV